jgi:hypothetical protein
MMWITRGELREAAYFAGFVRKIAYFFVTAGERTTKVVVSKKIGVMLAHTSSYGRQQVLDRKLPDVRMCTDFDFAHPCAIENRQKRSLDTVSAR